MARPPGPGTTRPDGGAARTPGGRAGLRRPNALGHRNDACTHSWRRGRPRPPIDLLRGPGTRTYALVSRGVGGRDAGRTTRGTGAAGGRSRATDPRPDVRVADSCERGPAADRGGPS